MNHKKIFKILIVLAFLFFVFGVFYYVRFTFFKGDMDENGNFHRYYTVKNLSIYTDSNDGHKEYKISNNSYVFLKNLKKGDVIGMPNVYGCAQFAILQNDYAFVYHHSTEESLSNIEKAIDKHMKFFNDKDDIYVSILHSKIDGNTQMNIENLIVNKIKNNLGKNVKIEKSLYEKIQNNKSYLYTFKAIITEKGFVHELRHRSKFLALRRTNEQYQGNVDATYQIRNHDMYNDFFIVAYANNKIVLFRQDIKKNVPENIFKYLGYTKPQVHLILPNSSNINSGYNSAIKTQLEFLLKKNFSGYNLKIMYYTNYTDHYKGRITKKGLVGNVRRY